MRVFHGFAEQLDVQAIVVQMDQITWELKAAWERANSTWRILMWPGTQEAASRRLDSLRALIADLDVGGVAREHVFFPLEGQTSEEAWATYRETADYVRNGLAQVGSFISSWQLSTALPKVAKDAGDALLKGSALLIAGASVMAFYLLTRPSGAQRALSGYRRRRRAR